MRHRGPRIRPCDDRSVSCSDVGAVGAAPAPERDEEKRMAEERTVCQFAAQLREREAGGKVIRGETHADDVVAGASGGIRCVVVVRAAARFRAPQRLPLWLSHSEARALAVLACTAPACAGDAEEEKALFVRLGRLLGAFSGVASSKRFSRCTRLRRCLPRRYAQLSLTRWPTGNGRRGPQWYCCRRTAIERCRADA